jgi:cholesterol transport system auxiliary component
VTGSRNTAAAAALALAAVSLGGCFSLFPKAEPSLLYRLGATEPVYAAGSVQGRRADVIRARVEFNRAAATDRILTVTGGQAAYIAGSRWVSPAPVLFEEALERAFARSPTAPRLSELGGASGAVAVLRLSVDNFETRYDKGPETAPAVYVRVRAELLDNRTRTLLGYRVFEGHANATENRVSAIVQAYDAATTQALSALADWTGAMVAGAAA